MRRTLAVMLLISASLGAEYHESIVVKTINTKTCPVKILGTGLYPDSDALSMVVLGNASQREIQTVQLTWKFFAADQKEIPGAGFGPVMAFKFAPGKLALVGRQGISMDTAESIVQRVSSGRGLLVLGVELVKFSDGTQWRNTGWVWPTDNSQDGLRSFESQLSNLSPPFHLDHPAVK